MPRLYREAPLNAIWEGSGNVICLDVLRAMAHAARVRAVPRRDRAGAGADARLDPRVDELEAQLADPPSSRRGRAVSSSAWRCAAGLAAGAPCAGGGRVAFCASRLGGDHGLAFGTLPAGSDFEAIIARSRPEAQL